MPVTWRLPMNGHVHSCSCVCGSVVCNGVNIHMILARMAANHLLLPSCPKSELLGNPRTLKRLFLICRIAEVFELVVSVVMVSVLASSALSVVWLVFALASWSFYWLHWVLHLFHGLHWCGLAGWGFGAGVGAVGRVAWWAELEITGIRNERPVIRSPSLPLSLSADLGLSLSRNPLGIYLHPPCIHRTCRLPNRRCSVASAGPRAMHTPDLRKFYSAVLW